MFQYLVMSSVWWTLCTSTNHVIPSCGPDVQVCSFRFHAAQNVTMTYFPDGPGGPMLPVHVTDDGTFIARSKSCDQNITVPTEVVPSVVIGDGTYKTVYLLNGKLPSEPIVVYEGQTVEVTLINDMENNAMTLHWHGLHMRDTPYMDGAAGVSQCPITYGEHFTYRFHAHPAGTHWYHAHYGTLRTEGIYGPLIVLPKSPQMAQQRRGDDPLPEFKEEFILTIQDWMHVSSSETLMLTQHEAVSFAKGFGRNKCYDSSKQADGADCGVIPFKSAVINGKGRFYKDSSPVPEDKNVPLERFHVQRGHKYRFRVISAAMAFGFRISIDGHVLHVIATDGNDVKTRPVQSLMIHPGERYDFWIEANDPGKSGLYWIRAETLEETRDGKHIFPGHVEAVLHYQGAPLSDPVSSRSRCTENKPCDILNCPFRGVPADRHERCIPITDLRSTLPEPTLTAPPGDMTEIFLNYHFTRKNLQAPWEVSVNGFRNIFPRKPLMLQPNQKKCEGTCPNECECNHVVKVPFGHVVQLVFAVTLNNPAGNINGNPHPVHLHGYNFQVLKIGFPEYESNTYVLKENSADLFCKDGDYCNSLEWANSSWTKGHVPDVIQEGAPRKDTIMFPAGGYAIVRLKADNPGFWFMHCHVEFHNLDGMSLVLQSGEPEQFGLPPNGFPTCGGFSWTKEELQSEKKAANLLSSDSLRSTDGDGARGMLAANIIATTMGLLAAILGTISIYQFVVLRRRHGYQPLTKPDN